MALTLNLRKEIDAPLERVFAVMTDLERASEWMPNLVGIEPLTPGKLAVGSRWRETRKMFGKAATEEFEVTGLTLNRSLELYIDGAKGSSKCGEYRFKYELAPMNGRTLVTLTGEIGGGNRFWRFIGRLFIGMFKKALMKDLLAMKQYLEVGRRSAPSTAAAPVTPKP
ncbi:MAG: SRPBCC family protein [Planctomycetota bacterium]